MSFAIFELDIRQPPATVHRHHEAWYVRCDLCGKRSPLAQLLSEALRVHDDHASRHQDDDELDLEQMLFSTRNPCVVHNSSTRQAVA